MSFISDNLRSSDALVTVVVPAYNHSTFIVDAIESVKCQTVLNWEMVIIDDGSTDNTWDVLQAYQLAYPDPRIRLFRQTNAGSHATINRGIEMARTPYLAILNSDDMYVPERLERLLAAAESAGPDFFAATGVRLVDAVGDAVVSTHPWQGMYRNLVDRWVSSQANEVFCPAAQALLWGNFTISTSNFFMSRSVWNRIGTFRHLRYVPDWDYALRVALELPDAFFFMPDQVLLCYRLHGNNTILGGALRNHIEAISILREFQKKLTLKGYITPPHAIDRIHHLYRSLRHQHVFQSLEKHRTAAEEKLHTVNAQLDMYSLRSEEYSQQVIELRAESEERLQQVMQLRAESEERLQQVMQLRAESEERLQQVMQLRAESEERLQQIMQLRAESANLQWQLSEARAESEERRLEIIQLRASTSWKITEPLRFMRRKFNAVSHAAVKLRSKVVHFARFMVATNARKVWLNLPIDTQYKQNFKHYLFSEHSGLFSWSQAYRRWQNQTLHGINSEIHNDLGIGADFAHELPTECLVPLLHQNALPSASLPVRLIAFYLPQFHAIPENNAWWGEGFTEWTNVRPAQPQFDGHYQPRIPGELGYYNLLDADLQSRQIELAKLYGIGAFCFYIYWFDGKLLLEKPVENYLNNLALDFPFCLCWANENWSRRWDGLDDQTLITQRHSPEDDLKFIQHFRKYFDDGRYVRIDGKPLILVYRPNLLPDAKATANRWRRWCRENGVGDIFLACTQSFEAVNPEKYGFDAAIEFPPINASPPNVTPSVTPLNDDFACSIYDWSIFVERSKKYTVPDYKLFRGVNPGWDNTARRKSNSSVLLNNSPCGYQEWLFNAVSNTCSNTNNLQERIVFVNAWNEWAEGAYLEPDQRYGYAYLEASRLALLRSSLVNQRMPLSSIKVIAFVIHAFYTDVFLEVLNYLKSITELTIKLYVTTVQANEDFVRNALIDSKFDYFLLIVENKGRDILPFMKIMPTVIDDGHAFFVKIHTKKSLHRVDGNIWRDDIYRKLMNGTSIFKAIRLFQQQPDIGILGPDDHLVAMSYYWGSNAKCVTLLASRLGVAASDLIDLNFVAGSMFMARTDAILPLLNLAINDSDFEAELGQIDGTLAHSIERLFSVSAHSIKLSTTCPNSVCLTEYEFAER